MKRALLILAALAAACSRDPQETVRRNLASADRYLSRKQHREAEILLQRVLKVDPKSAGAYTRLIDIYLTTARLGEAIRPLRRAIELLPDGSERRARIGQLADCLLFYLERSTQDARVREEVESLAVTLGETYDGYRIRGRLFTIEARALAEKGGTQSAAEEIRQAVLVLEKAEALRPLVEDVTVPLARSLYVEGEHDRAIRLLDQLAAKTPSSTAAWSDLIRFLEMRGRVDEADRKLREAIRANPDHYTFYLRLATHWAQRRDRDKAEAAIADLRSTAARNPLAYEQVAAFYRDTGRLDDAIAELETAKTRIPQRAPLIELQIIDLYLAVGKRDLAHQRTEALLRADPKNPAGRARRASLLLDSGKFDESIAELEALARETPSDITIHYTLGRARRRAGQLEMARIALSEALRLSPGFVAAQRELMVVLVASESWGPALIAAERVLESGPDTGAGLVRAAALRQLGKLTEARAQIDQLAAWGAPEGPRLLELGKLEAAGGRKKEALATLRAAFAAGSVEALIESARVQGDAGQAYAAIEADCRRGAANPALLAACADFALNAGRVDAALSSYDAALAATTDAGARALLLARSGEALRRARRVPEALKRLEQATAAQPDHAEANHLLGLALDQSGRSDEAMAAYERSLKANPNNPAVLNNLAWHLYRTGGNLDVAQTYAQRARQLHPENLEFADTLGMIYLRKNLRTDAIAIFRDLVRKQPGNPSFREHLRQAEQGS